MRSFPFNSSRICIPLETKSRACTDAASLAVSGLGTARALCKGEAIQYRTKDGSSDGKLQNAFPPEERQQGGVMKRTTLLALTAFVVALAVNIALAQSRSKANV